MTSVSFWTSNSASTTDFTTTWLTAATDTIYLGFQGFLQVIDYVSEKIEEIFDNRDRIKQYRTSLFTDKTHQPTITNKKQPHTIMIPPKRNFKGKASQRR